MSKATKIVATIGPATETEELIEQLITNGMNVARFNTKHGTPEWHQERIKRVRQVSERMGVPIGILLDLQGPEIRLTIPGGEPFEVTTGQEVRFTANDQATDPRTPFLPANVIQTLQPGHEILIDDGAGEFEIKSKTDTELITMATGNFTVGNRKTVNTPGVVVDMPSLIPQDLVHLDAATDDLIDFVGLSFVRDTKDIDILRDEMKKRNLHADIIAKIENQSALDHLEEIIADSDAVMVARGDLAVEVPFRELTYWQKLIITRCREYGKPVITATQMLKSMVSSPRPTRAEVSDVAHAIYDGTDAVMLSEETTIGQFPVESVATQTAIAEFNETHTCFTDLAIRYTGTCSYITQAAINLLRDSLESQGALKIDKIVCLTESGTTARYTARLRPNLPIIALTSNPQTYRKLSLLYAVTPHVVQLPPGDQLESSAGLLKQLTEHNLAESGKTVLLVHGTFWKQPGLTNTVTLVTIP